VPVKVRPRAPAPSRLASHTRVDRGGRLPIPIRLVLVLGVVALSVAVLYVGAGGLSRAAAAVGASLTGFMDELAATPSPSPSELFVTDAPDLESPEEPYTNEAARDLVFIVPAELAGDSEHRIRVFQQLKDQQPVAIGEWPIGATQRVVVPVELETGINDFTAILVGPGGQSEPSAVVRYVLDATPPKITIVSPKANAKVNASSVEIKGKTQGRSSLIARNEANDASISVAAESDGTFTMRLAIRSGSNVIRISGTDPAGNVGETTITVRRGSGKLSVALSASDYIFKRGRLPDPIRLTATVTDPDGRALQGAAVTFTLSVPGIATITREGTTNAAGRVIFETTIPRSATLGQGLAAVLVRTNQFGSIDDRVVVTIEK
jgi:hypothetical protein